MNKINPDEFVKEPGSYILVLNLEKSKTICIGKLGYNYFPKGWYIYCGSAQGSGGIKARLMAHIRKSEKKHWHIDWFLEYAKIKAVYYSLGVENNECIWSKKLVENKQINAIVKKFGSSDCRKQCLAHFYHFVTGKCFSDMDVLIHSVLSTQIESVLV